MAAAAREGESLNDGSLSAKLEALTVSLDSDGEGLILKPGEDVLRSEDSVTLNIGAETLPCAGKLFLTSQRVAWVPRDKQAARPYAFDLLSVVIHAQSNAGEGQKGAIYLQVELKLEEASSPDEDIETLEVLLSPENESCLGELFNTLCDCVAMNPDLEESDDSGEERCIETTVNLQQDSGEANELSEKLRDEDHRFADAE
mmetsp:Transcript_4544/g.11857  ORF Transcript_4544/g.11857 Transcript_4544/m.11857 type:complete len:201 (+) Transcript_4544:17-619(+)